MKGETWYRKALESRAERMKEIVMAEIKKDLHIESPSAPASFTLDASEIGSPVKRTEYALNILGTLWTLKEVKKENDQGLDDCDGYTDRSTRTIVVRGEKDGEPHELENYEVYLKAIKRHEIIHAFLYESGLAADYEHQRWGHNETSVDWLAIQFPKMIEVFKAADAI